MRSMRKGNCSKSGPRWSGEGRCRFMGFGGVVGAMVYATVHMYAYMFTGGG